MQAESKWGSAFFDTLSEDLRKMFPGTKGFSTTNLRYMKRYYDMFGEILPQLEAELSDITNLPQVGAEIYAIPWGHIKVIVDKCKGNPEKALFFVDEVIKNNWSRAVLLNFLDGVDVLVEGDEAKKAIQIIEAADDSQSKENSLI